LHLVENFPEIRSFHGENLQLHDSELAAFAHCARLESLYLEHNAIRGEGLRYLARMADLQDLLLDNNQISDRHLVFHRSLVFG
jgi:hypothetical protein